ncbi:MAG TPA: endonuclease domain-containing protein [Gemmatimonadales bacterium]|nr:endonuclease domain-containing protein [Gemmatimonadales bacterium]
MDPLRSLSRGQLYAAARQLRRQRTPAERYAWSLLRNRRILGLKFRRQHVVHGFIVDFYCIAERIILELEGDAHDSPAQRSYDNARSEFLAAAGYRTIRIRNRDVTPERLESVLKEALGLAGRPPSPERRGGQGVRTARGREKGDREGQGVRTLPSG